MRTVELNSARSSDQDFVPSLVEKKFSQNNQIDIGSEVISQGLAEAITSISRAPLPFVSTTVRHVKITTPGSVRYDDDIDYQISKRADSIPTGSESQNWIVFHSKLLIIIILFAYDLMLFQNFRRETSSTAVNCIDNSRTNFTRNNACIFIR